MVNKTREVSKDCRECYQKAHAYTYIIQTGVWILELIPNVDSKYQIYSKRTSFVGAFTSLRCPKPT